MARWALRGIALQSSKHVKPDQKTDGSKDGEMKRGAHWLSRPRTLIFVGALWQR